MAEPYPELITTLCAQLGYDRKTYKNLLPDATRLYLVQWERSTGRRCRQLLDWASFDVQKDLDAIVDGFLQAYGLEAWSAEELKPFTFPEEKKQSAFAVNENIS